MSDLELSLELDGQVFYDKIYGCWVGKNAGGTLGTPLETRLGQPEPFDVSWYPELTDGALPNDDLELQLIWLKALEEVGPGLTERDLARYWLDHVGYNWDEYGLSKTNLRLGLEPPLSGYFNNWFKDCMGCPIRSEIWASVAPGAPRVAVRYAFADAICDHAGGESVYGELFNAAVESAAFVVDDRRTLIDIGLSYIPPQSTTAAAIHAAISGHEDGLDWKTARERVMAAAPHYVAQYSPINLGFQVIGLLYGTDFGDALCTTVNCGYDTDSSGATIGSYLGILTGASGLPAKWVDPLGDKITTNESWGGVRHLSDGPNPAPKTIDELVQRIRRVAERVLAAHHVLDETGAVRVTRDDLYADERAMAMLSTSPTQVHYPGTDIDVTLDYLDGPAVTPQTTKTIHTKVTNRRPDPLSIRCSVLVPSGWPTPPTQDVDVPAHGQANLDWAITVPPRERLHNSNRLYVTAAPLDRPAPPAVPLVLVGATVCRISGPYPRQGRSDEQLLEATLPPQSTNGELTSPDGRDGDWREIYALDNAVPLTDIFTEPGVLYIQTFLRAPTARQVRLVVDASCPFTCWVNNDRLSTANRYRGLRPAYGALPDAVSNITLEPGWNELLIKLVRDDDTPPPECHIALATTGRIRDGQPHLRPAHFPWDRAPALTT